MNLTQSIRIAERHDPSYSSAISAPSISSLPMLLTASVVFLAVDAAVTILRRRSSQQKKHESVTSTHALPPLCPSLKHLVAKTKSILSDVDALEKQLEHERHQFRKLEPSADERRHRRRQRPAAIPARKDNSTIPYIHNLETGHGLSSEFSAFCDRLLLTNRIWKQEKQLKSLESAVESKTQALKATAFQTFCDQLLLWNRIWRLEREAKTLVEEGEKLKRSRVAAITRAAKRMVLDVQKERMVEEFVKDIIEEAEEGKREVERLKEEHKREVRKIQGEWVNEYRGVTRELERLRLAQIARMIEQELANEVEEAMFRSLTQEKKHVQELDAKLAVLENGTYAYASSNEEAMADMSTVYYSYEDESTDVELDTLSELSSSSTCVAFSDSGHQSTGATSTGSSTNPQRRRRCVSHGATSSKRGPLLLKSATVPNVDPVAFALKPLVIDQADAFAALDASLAVATRTCNHSGRPLAVRTRTTSVLLHRPMKSSGLLDKRLVSGKEAAAASKEKVPWRF